MENPRCCTYLPDETASLEYRVFDDLDAADFQPLLERGWRRFGNYCFRPACSACGECRSIRIDAASFRPTKSQRKTLRGTGTSASSGDRRGDAGPRRVLTRCRQR